MPVCRFEIVARPDPQTLARLINFFAQRGMVPKAVQAREDEGVMRILIEQHDLPLHEAGIIADKMRASWLVDDVRLRWDGRYQLPLSDQEMEQAA